MSFKFNVGKMRSDFVFSSNFILFMLIVESQSAVTSQLCFIVLLTFSARQIHFLSIHTNNAKCTQINK